MICPESLVLIASSQYAFMTVSISASGKDTGKTQINLLIRLINKVLEFSIIVTFEIFLCHRAIKYP